MAEGSVDDIFVEIEVRLQRLEAGMRQSEQIVSSSVSRMNRVTQRVGEGFGSISSNVQKALITLGALHISLRAVESLADVASAGFGLWTANIEDSRVAAEEFLQAIEKIPEIGAAFGAGRGLGELFLGFREFFEQEFDPIVAQIDRFLVNIDKSSVRHAPGERQIARELGIASIIGRQGKAADRELKILGAINKEEQIRLKFVHEREDLERAIFVLNRKAGRLGEASVRVHGDISRFQQLMEDLIDARERAALKKLERTRFRDPTSSFVTPLGTFTTGTGQSVPSLIERTNQKLSALTEVVQEIGFA